MSRVNKIIISSLVLALAFSATVSAEPEPQSWEHEEWNDYFKKIAQDVIKELAEYVMNPKLEVKLEQFGLFSDVITDGRYSEIYFIIKVGNQERRLPGHDDYWPTESGKKRALYTENTTTFDIPPFEDFHYILVEAWDYDFLTDDLLDWAVFKYDTSSQTAFIYDTRETSQVGVKWILPRKGI